LTDRQTQIHPTAIVNKGAHIGVGVDIGPYAVIGSKVVIGDGCTIGAHGVIEGRTSIGRDNLISAFASIGSRPQDLKYKNEDTELVIGDRNMFREYCNVSLGTEGGGGRTVIGDSGLFMVYTHVAHDCRIGNNVIVANGVALAGHVEVGDGAVLGGLSAVHQFCRVGRLSMTAGGAMVTQDIVPYGMVHGDRARINGLNVIGLRRLGVKAEEMRAIKDMYRLVFEENLTLDTAVSRIRDEIADSVYKSDWLAFLAKGERGLCR
jgi:UDP-N-acetylglucosamine acyltransferase